MIYRFGVFELDGDGFELRCDGTAVVIEPQVFEVIAHLVRNRDRLVSGTPSRGALRARDCKH
jgi:DNA-binding winged helix-turn-helix (wHTH) protein